MRSRLILCAVALAMLDLLSCRKRIPEARSGLASSLPQRVQFQSPAEAASASKTREESPASPAAVLARPIPSEARKLIRTGQLAVEVKDFAASARRAEAVADRLGGYVAGSRASRDQAGIFSGSLTLRVPAERFDGALRELASLGRVESESVNTEDVTRAYYDLEGRIRVARDAEGRIREILRTRTARLSDVLEAERELSRVVGEIEQMEGERRFYDRQTSLSTITAELHEPQAITRPGSLGPLREAIHDSLGALAASIAALIILAMYALPWIILAALLFVLVRRALRRRKSA